MKKEIHPNNYRPVVFKDSASDAVFLTRSCAKTEETTVLDGKEYPMVLLGISSESHPFFTGKKTFVDTAGRIDKFNKRFSGAKAANVKKKKK